ncbi:PREDICTED: 52 kDa repressor of the inhibitor of the protein kinase-like isoform X3 [Cyphomyrmex costatus]|uniref:52 kDa repressor of the inhibitor of the protein kinase-like isoform X3 n=1 Tax=Cyphomyrmex costatus TaxID=456900 RepID=UPI0008522D2E|nr:PREDICTED: 52 kDa repressor of the inhibitor of the protein kinase-like isoform X3 [Cyphomyrmex costatus]
MLAHKSKWCVAKGCNNNITEKRHFFSFPKEHDRWLQWIHACQRLDLQVMGPEYAYRNCRLCHLHFEEKWYKIGKIRAHLYPDAIPTIFFERDNILATSAIKEDSNSTTATSVLKEDGNLTTVASALEENSDKTIGKDQQKETNSNMQLSKAIDPMDIDIETAETSKIVTPSTSSSKHLISRVEETPLKRKMKERHLKLQAENRKLRERIRRLQKKIKKMENKKVIEDGPKEYETLRQLSCV